MPRTARIDIPGLLQHVIVRGIERRDIFLDDDDRRLFLERFSRLLADTGTDCLAWSLLSNHFHLLLCPRATKLSVFMRRLLTGYAIVFNRRHKRTGHLFQNRYKSIACQEDAYLLELVRYIHLNPLRAGLVKTIDELDSYPWCGHGVLMGKRELPGQFVESVLQMFGQRKKIARQSYLEFVADGIRQGRRDELVGGGLRRSQSMRNPGGYEAYDDRILGSGEFVESLWRQTQEDSDIVASKVSIDDMVKRAAEALGVSAQFLRQRNRIKELVDARAAICYLAVRECGFSGVEIAKALNMTRSGVSVAVCRGAEIVRSNSALKNKLFD